jgi:MFS family permease
MLDRAITNHVASICKSGLFIPLALGWLFLVAFLFWQDCWERDSTQGVQDSLWTDSHFICISLVVFFVYFSYHSSSQLVVLVFERVQALSVLQSSWRFVPVPVAAAVGGLVTRKFLPRVRANKLLGITILISSLSPFIMAISNPASSYWGYEFFAVSLGSIAPGAIILISTMMINEDIPPESQGLATGVICTVAMVGSSVGMSLAGFISHDVLTYQRPPPGERGSLIESSEAMMSGYRVAFWFLFAMNLVGLGITLCCLRRIGYLGRLSSST